MEKFFSTKGRLNRTNYFIHYCIYVALVAIPTFLLLQIFPNINSNLTQMLTFFTLLLILMSPIQYVYYCSTVKRLHDLDRPSSDFWLFFKIGRGWLLEYTLFLQAGTYGKNQYGYPQSAPKGKTARY